MLRRWALQCAMAPTQRAKLTICTMNRTEVWNIPKTKTRPQPKICQCQFRDKLSPTTEAETRLSTAEASFCLPLPRVVKRHQDSRVRASLRSRSSSMICKKWGTLTTWCQQSLRRERSLILWTLTVRNLPKTTSIKKLQLPTCLTTTPLSSSASRAKFKMVSHKTTTWDLLMQFIITNNITDLDLVTNNQDNYIMRIRLTNPTLWQIRRWLTSLSKITIQIRGARSVRGPTSPTSTNASSSRRSTTTTSSTAPIGRKLTANNSAPNSLEFQINPWQAKDHLNNTLREKTRLMLPVLSIAREAQESTTVKTQESLIFSITNSHKNQESWPKWKQCLIQSNSDLQRVSSMKTMRRSNKSSRQGKQLAHTILWNLLELKKDLSKRGKLLINLDCLETQS